MALVKCPMCHKRASNMRSSCSKCGNLFPKYIKYPAKTQSKTDEVAKKINWLPLGCIAWIALIVVAIGLVISSMVSDNNTKKIRGYCDNCGRKSSFTIGSFDYCSSCYSAFLRYKDNKK